MYKRQTQFPEEVWLTEADGRYQLACDSQRLLDELADEGMNVQHAVLQPASTKATVHLAEYGELYQLLGRVTNLAKTAPDTLVKEFVAETLSMPESTEVERQAKQRVGQDIFRNALIAFWKGRCAVTGLSVVSLLRASHIKPWADCTDDKERLNVFNGLLLAPHLDALFDGGWITFDDEGRLVKSSFLDDAAVHILGVTGEMKLAHLASSHHIYLEYHRQHVFKATE